MKKILAIALCLCLMGFPHAAQNAPEPMDTENPDYQLLLRTGSFAYGGTGYAGTIPEGIFALANLCQKEDAVAYLKAIEQNGNAGGRLYGLCGLYFLDYPYYLAALPKYTQTDETLLFANGCIVYPKYPIRDLMVCPGAIQLQSQEQTLEDYLDANGAEAWGPLDFAGGGIPEMLREYLFA